MRSATSVGANYRAACRAQSRNAFISKMAIVEEEADECQFWLDLLIELDLATTEVVAPLLDEAQQLTAIASASKSTARQNAR